MKRGGHVPSEPRRMARQVGSDDATPGGRRPRPYGAADRVFNAMRLTERIAPKGLCEGRRATMRISGILIVAVVGLRAAGPPAAAPRPGGPEFRGNLTPGVWPAPRP